MRDLPPDNQQGKFGYASESAGVDQDENEDLDPVQGQKLALECYESSTSWLNSGRRSKWNDSLRAFQSLHPSGSKYLSNDYRYRSCLYRPKTRAMVRKAEAQTAAAFFSNQDVVSVSPQDDDDKTQLASAEIMQALLQYRLTKTIPWFQTVVGARQDCEVMGICIGKAYWKYQEKKVASTQHPSLDEMGMPTGEMEWVDHMEVSEDRPQIDLIAAENFRFDAAADWRDPISSSPYLIELIPMYVADVKARCNSGEWHKISDSALLTSTGMDDDATRRSREQGRVPGADNDAWKPRDFSICWVRENIIRWQGQDWHYFTLGGAGELLTDPVPIKEVYLHGERPYVVGNVVLEAHKTYPSSKVELVRDLQRSANDDWNLRFDNVKLALNPRQFVRSGQGIDIQDVRTFMPGKVIMTKNPGEDVVWDRPPDVTQSAYAEQDRINLDFDELVGDFSNSSVQATQMQEQSATGMNLMSGQASGMNEYELRLFAETFVERMLRLLIKLEQTYETDPVVLALAGNNAQVFQKYGVSQITDDLLNQELTCSVNVGIGATNPQIKLKNFIEGADALGKMYGPTLASGTNFPEVAKEIFALLGYKDGERFFKPDFDPRVAQLQQELQKLQQHQKAPAAPAQPPMVDPNKLHEAQLQAAAQLKIREMQNDNDMQIAQIDAQTKKYSDDAQTYRDWLSAQREMVTAQAVNPQAGAMFPAPHGDMVNPANSAPLPAQPTQAVPDAPQAPSPQDHAMLALAQAVAAIGQGQQQTLALLEQMIKAPKQVIRDGSGRVVGLRHGDVGG